MSIYPSRKQFHKLRNDQVIESHLEIQTGTRSRTFTKIYILIARNVNELVKDITRCLYKVDYEPSCKHIF
jgi:hypothetical protein